MCLWKTLNMKPLVEETVEDSESGHIYSPCQLVHPSRVSGCGKQYRWGHWGSSRSQSCGSSLHLKDQRRSRVWPSIVSSTWGAKAWGLPSGPGQPGLSQKHTLKIKFRSCNLNLGLRPTRVDGGFPVNFYSHLFMKGCVSATGDSMRRDAGPRMSRLTGLQYPYTSHQSCVPEEPLVVHQPASLAQNPAECPFHWPSCLCWH